MENVCQLTGKWITFKDSNSGIFRIEFPLSIPRQEAWSFTDITKVSHTVLADSAGLGQAPPTHFDGCTLRIETWGQILIKKKKKKTNKLSLLTAFNNLFSYFGMPLLFLLLLHLNCVLVNPTGVSLILKEFLRNRDLATDLPYVSWAGCSWGLLPLPGFMGSFCVIIKWIQCENSE